MSTITQSQLTFESGNKSIRIDAYLPDSGGKHPSVLALYGSGGGVSGMSGPATMLAEQGFAVFVLHYFDRTGTTGATDKPTIVRNSQPGEKPCGTQSVPSRNSRRWTRHGLDCLDFHSALISRSRWRPWIRA